MQLLRPQVGVSYNLRFPGQYYLPETGLYYNYFRDYDPQTGRYIESDPMGLEGGGWSTYAYVGDGPIMYIDPFGLCWQYSQTTGQWSHVDDNTGIATPVGSGWSGQGPGFNNPAMQWAENVGPIPMGLYTIGPGRVWHNMPNVMPLIPVLAQQFGRPGGYLIHGANRDPAKAPTSSQGCIISDKALRKLIDNSNDKCLWVVQ